MTTRSELLHGSVPTVAPRISALAWSPPMPLPVLVPLRPLRHCARRTCGRDVSAPQEVDAEMWSCDVARPVMHRVTRDSPRRSFYLAKATPSHTSRARLSVSN